MEYTIAYCIYLYGCAARGDAPEPPVDAVDWDSVYRICQRHKSASLFFPAVKRLWERGYRGIEQQLYDMWRNTTIQSVVGAAARQSAAVAAVKAIEDAGIPNIVLKGESLSLHYAEPQYRISLDTDIIVPPDYENKVLSLMAELGAQITTRLKKYHHSRCALPGAGLIEIHVTLVDEIYSDTCFNRYNELPFHELNTQRCISQDGTPFTGLAGEDEFIFVTNHFIKHFVSAGCNIRNVLDILVLMRDGRESLDWQRILGYYRTIRMDKLLVALLEGGVNRFGFRREELPELGSCPAELADATLVDILNTSSKAEGEGSVNFFALTRKRFEAEGKQSYRGYIMRWRVLRGLGRFFPGAKKLRLEYPYARTNPLLLPVAFFHNIGRAFRFYFVKYTSKNPDPLSAQSEIDSATEGRMKLFRDLDMV